MPTITAVARSEVFISYSHEDKRWLKDLEKHLTPYIRTGAVRAWSDERIRPGSKWFDEIKAALASAKVVVLLVTPSFLASDFIQEEELAHALKQAEQGGVRILWIPVRGSSYQQTPLYDYHAVIDPARPLARMKKAERDIVWVDICKEIAAGVNP